MIDCPMGHAVGSADHWLAGRPSSNMPNRSRRVRRFTRSRPGERSRMRAIGALFLRHGIESTPEGCSLRLLRAWLSPAQRAHFAEKGLFRSRRRRHWQAIQDLCRRWDERLRGRRKRPPDTRPVFRAGGRVANRRRHAFPEDRAGKLRERRARGGKPIRSERFLVSAKPASWLSRESANGVEQAGARSRGSAVSLEECSDG